MGNFLQTALLPGQTPEEIKKYIEEIAAARPAMKLNPTECIIHAYPSGVGILFSEDTVGYEELADALSRKTGSAVLLCYLYDDDFWGYYFWENGRELDRFSPVPDYFDEGEDYERRYAGNPGLIARYFGIAESAVKNYYRRWYSAESDTSGSPAKPSADNASDPICAQLADETADPQNGHCDFADMDGSETAYPQDEYSYGDCWQIADFMERLGYPWDGFEEETGSAPICEAAPNPANTPPAFVRVSERPVPDTLPFLVHETLEDLPGIFDVPYIWGLLKHYPEELFLQFDHEHYDDAAETLTKLLRAQTENAELYILRAYCLLSHPRPPRAQDEDEKLARTKQARLDLDRAFLLAPDNVRLLRMHCLPPERLRHYSSEPVVSDEMRLYYIDRLLLLDAGHTPSYLLAAAYCHERMGERKKACALLTELTHRELPQAVDFSLSFEGIWKRLMPDTSLQEELERDYKTYIREFMADNPKKKFRQAELCYKKKRTVTAGQVRYEKNDLSLLVDRAPRPVQ